MVEALSDKVLLKLRGKSRRYADRDSWAELLDSYVGLQERNRQLELITAMLKVFIEDTPPEQWTKLTMAIWDALKDAGEIHD